MLCALFENETGNYYMSIWQNTHIRQIRIPRPDKTGFNKQVQKALGSQGNPSPFLFFIYAMFPLHIGPPLNWRFTSPEQLTWGSWWVSTRWRIAWVTHCKDLQSMCDTVIFCNTSLITPHNTKRQYVCNSQLQKCRHNLHTLSQLFP